MAARRIDQINRKTNFLQGLSFPEEKDEDEVSKDSFNMTELKEPINGQVNPAFEDDEWNGSETEGTEEDDVFESASSQGDIKNSSPQPNGDIKKRKSTKKKENHLWDVFRVTSEDNISQSDLAIWKTVFIITKMIFVFLFFVVVLATAVITKTTFLIMTSNIYLPSNFSLDGTKRLKELDGKLLYKDTGNEGKVEVRWIWALITVMSAPYFFTICKCLWRLCFNKTRPLKIIPLLLVLVTETLHSFGLFILMVVVLPQTEPLAAAFLILPMATIPSILKIIYPERTLQNQEGAMLIARLVNTVAFVLSVTSIGCFCFYIKYSEGSTTLMVLTAICPVLISLSWWENFARQGDKESIGIPKLKRKIRQCKTKISILTNVWKLVLNYGVLPSLVFGTNCQAGTNCIHIFYLQLEWSSNTTNTYLFPPNTILTDSSINDCITTLPFLFALINIGSSIICFKVGKAACKILAQKTAYSLPLVLSTPITISLVVGLYSQPLLLSFTKCDTLFPHWNGDASTIVDIVSWYWPVLAGGVAGFFSLLLITNYIWSPGKERLVSTDKLFVQPLYCGVLLDQSMMLNRRRVDDEFKSMDEKNKSSFDIPIPDLPTDNPNWNPSEDWSILRKDDTPMIYMCATMWHETELEMTQILKSIFRMDEDQCARRNLQMFLGIKDPDYYEFEVHIFFDDAFEKHAEDEYEYKVNNYVKMLVRVINLAATFNVDEFNQNTIHHNFIKFSLKLRTIPPPTKIPTPYGGRLIWRLPGGNKIIAHLKDKMKIRHRKRWSQVMYMYYFLGYKLISMKIPRKRKKTISENTFLLALDGDVDFQPSAVQLLVDRMKKSPTLGATCGRIHPIGSGPMVWYQKFEYAISHWLQKATEHTLGCVLCSPGCFSLFRGSSLMDDNVMRRYTTPPSEPAHYVQYDQGEDRWLCTLLLQQGYRVEYVAASDALTYAPEGFNEFYNQRRRWSPSTMANILDLLMDWKNVRRKNDDISLPYIGYQMFLMVSSILTPGTIFLMILGAITTGFPAIEPWTALVLNLLPVIIFVLLCFVAKSEVQLTYAAILSVIYSLVMMIVLVGLLREAATAGFCSVTSIFLCFVAGVFVLSAFLHPQEFFCIIHGFLYFLSIPSMSMLLMIYSLGNLHVVSWGTRETTQPIQSATQQKANQKKGVVQGWLERFGMADAGNDESSDYNFSCGNLFRCMCCPQQSSKTHDNHLAVILERLDDIESRMTEYTRSHNNSQYLSPTSSVANEKHIEEPKPFSKNALLFEGEGERENPLFREEKQKKRDELIDPYWIHDEDIKDGATVYLPNDEVEFWDQFIGEYLFPIVEDTKQKKEIEKGLLQLRNKVCLAFLLINAMFVTIVYALTEVNDSEATENKHGSLSVPLWCALDKGGVNKQATVEPISFAFTAVFGVLLLIQFICMLFHRTATLLHILASTEIGVKKRIDKMRKSPEEGDNIADITVADGLKLVRDMQASNDDDSDTKSVISVATTIASEDDAEDTIASKEKKDLWKKLARRRKDLGHNTLSKNFLKNFNKLHQVIHEDDNASTRGISGSDEKEEAEDSLTKVQNKFGKRFQRQSLYTIVNMAKNPQLKQRISERAERVSRWKDLQKKLIKDPEQQKGRSGFASIAKLALQKEKMKQQQSVEEQEETAKDTSKADINPQLPDRGEEWPEEDNYAIPDYAEIDDNKTEDLKNSDVLF